MIKGSSCVSIHSVQKTAEQVEGRGRERAARHEVKRNEGEDNPGITLEWDKGDRAGSGSLPEPLALPFDPGLQAALTDEVRHKQEDVFFWHRGGLFAVRGPLSRYQLCLNPTCVASPSDLRTLNPTVPARTQMINSAAGWSVEFSGKCTPPFG